MSAFPSIQNILRSALVLISGVSLTQCGGQPSRSARVSVPTVPTPQFEREFLENRVAHQQAAVDMAQSCIQKAQHDELKQFCGELLKKEQSELNQLQEWLGTWYPGTQVSPQRKEKMTQGYRNFLESVRSSSGAQFEESLLAALRLHHHEGVSESEACASGAVHSELKTLCQSARTEQEREIKQMSGWICQWFKDCVEQ